MLMKLKFEFLYPAAALFLCLCTYLHWIPQKEGLHIDEALWCTPKIGPGEEGGVLYKV
jgi:hypothetical protein